MNDLDLWLLAVGLAMDCLAMSIASGVILKKVEWPPILLMAVCFGFFQAFMPLLSWGVFAHVSHLVQQIDHWIAFGLLLYLGINMIREAFSEEEERHFNPRRLPVVLTLSVATSIDALAVGISFACTGYAHLRALLYPLAVIGMVSFALSLAGSVAGAVFGASVAKKIKPELLGGIILIAISCKIVYQHLTNGL